MTIEQNNAISLQIISNKITRANIHLTNIVSNGARQEQEAAQEALEILLSAKTELSRLSSS